MLTTALAVYVAGVVVGLMRIDAAPLTRVTVALLWPIGVVAGVVTLGGLVLATLVLFPMLGAAAVVAAAVVWFLVSS